MTTTDHYPQLVKCFGLRSSNSEAQLIIESLRAIAKQTGASESQQITLIESFASQWKVALTSQAVVPARWTMDVRALIQNGFYLRSVNHPIRLLSSVVPIESRPVHETKAKLPPKDMYLALLFFFGLPMTGTKFAKMTSSRAMEMIQKHIQASPCAMRQLSMSPDTVLFHLQQIPWWTTWGPRSLTDGQQAALQHVCLLSGDDIWVGTDITDEKQRARVRMGTLKFLSDHKFSGMGGRDAIDTFDTGHRSRAYKTTCTELPDGLCRDFPLVKTVCTLDIFGNVISPWVPSVKSVMGGQTDHWWPVALGGKTVDSNARFIHWKANSAKSGEIPFLLERQTVEVFPVPEFLRRLRKYGLFLTLCIVPEDIDAEVRGNYELAAAQVETWRHKSDCVIM